MDSKNPYDAMKELDCCSIGYRVALMEEDEIKVLEQQIQAEIAEGKRWETRNQSLKRQIAAVDAKADFERAKLERLRHRKAELEPEVRRLTKKLEKAKARTAQAKAALEAKGKTDDESALCEKSNNNNKNLCVDRNRPTYSRYMDLEEEKRKLAEEVAAKEKIVKEHEKYLKTVKKLEKFRREEFKMALVSLMWNLEM